MKTEKNNFVRPKQTVRVFCPYLCIILFLLFCFSAFQVSSASSPPPPVQTGTGLPLNAFSWASPAPDIVGVAAVNNTAGMLFGRGCQPRHRTATGVTALEWAVSMHPGIEVVVLLEVRVPAGCRRGSGTGWCLSHTL